MPATGSFPDCTALDALVAEGTVPGYAVALRRGDDVTHVAGGVADLETRSPFGPDTVHRVASLSKPVAALVTMQQVEAGALALDDPITTWLPELADLRVLTAPDAPLGVTERLRRPVLVRHLLTMTSGFGILRDETPLSRAMAEAGIHPGPVPPALPTAGVLERLAALPLAFQPGEGWAYHTSTDVLSVLLARAAGRGLDEVVESGVREPLGLAVLGFSAPDASSVATLYDPEPEGLTPTEPWGLQAPPPFLTLSAGLFATAPDYLRVLDELTRPTTVESASAALISTVQLSDEQARAAGDFLPPGYSYGFQVAVAVRDDPQGPRRGSFGWSGGSGCFAVADPVADRAGVLLTNRQLGGPDGSPAFDPFLATMYGVGTVSRH
jgi:CubicO group peptidase (beta-lactamase class C family)